MAGSFSDYFENVVLDEMTGKSPSTTRYIALATSAITDATTGSTIVEPSNSGTAYARKSTSASDWASASAGATSNSAIITFATATGGGWGTVTHFAICDSGTYGAGNILGWADLTVSKSISAGDTASFAVGELDITLV